MTAGGEPLRVGILGAARIAELAIVKPAKATGTRLVSVAARSRSRAEAFADDNPTFVGHARMLAMLVQRGEFYRNALADVLGIEAAGDYAKPGLLVSDTAELDLGGRLLHERNASALDVQAREQLLADARLLVQANVARGYLALRALDAEREIVQGTVAAYGETLSLTSSMISPISSVAWKELSYSLLPRLSL